MSQRSLPGDDVSRGIKRLSANLRPARIHLLKQSKGGVVIAGDFNANHDQAIFSTQEHSIPLEMLDTKMDLKDYL